MASNFVLHHELVVLFAMELFRTALLRIKMVESWLTRKHFAFLGDSDSLGD